MRVTDPLPQDRHAASRQPAPPTRLPALILAAAGLAVALSGCGKQAAGNGPGGFSVPVEVAPVVQQDWPVMARAVGSLKADEHVTIKNAVAGFVETIEVREGDNVEPRDVLLRIEDRKLELAVRQAEARFEEAQANLKRKQPLFEADMIADSEIIEAQSEFKAAEAALGLARERLEDSVVRAPFGGRLGQRHVAVGDYLDVATPLIDLVKIDMLKLEFTLPEKNLPRVATGQSVEIRSATYPGETFEGTIDFIDPVVDESTRTVRLRAVVNNRDLKLRPNLFVNVQLQVDIIKDARIVPEQAVIPGLGSTAIFVVQDGKAVRRTVDVVARAPGRAVVSSGLEDGEQVVTAGQQKLRDQTPVQVSGEEG